MGNDKMYLTTTTMNLREEFWRGLGFEFAFRRPNLTLAFALTGMMIPRVFYTSWGEELVASTEMYMVVFPDVECDEMRPISEINAHPVEWSAFAKTYRPMDVKFADLNLAQQRILTDTGARPYTRYGRTLAKQVVEGEEFELEGLEHREKVLVPVGNWIMIGVNGEPYHMTNDSFCSRYTFDDSEANTYQ